MNLNLPEQSLRLLSEGCSSQYKVPQQHTVLPLFLRPKKSENLYLMKSAFSRKICHFIFLFYKYLKIYFRRFVALEGQINIPIVLKNIIAFAEDAKLFYSTFLHHNCHENYGTSSNTEASRFLKLNYIISFFSH